MGKYKEVRYEVRETRYLSVPYYWSKTKKKADEKAKEFLARGIPVEVVRAVYEFEDAHIPGLSDVSTKKRRR